MAIENRYTKEVAVGTPMITSVFAIALSAQIMNGEYYNPRFGGLMAIIQSEILTDRRFTRLPLSSSFDVRQKASNILALTGNREETTNWPQIHWTETAIGKVVSSQRGDLESVCTEKNPEYFLTQFTFAVPSTSTLYGHFAYNEAPRNELINVGNGQKLRRAAAVKFREMVAAAAKKGIKLVALSGFRDISTQRRLFYGVAANRRQTLQERAKVSAPPGYSEHHTGYVMDIGYGAAPELNLSQSFENTLAFRWLFVNAKSYGFELSFPRNNSQGVAYEPWHWRFVGDAESQETFKAARASVQY